MKVKKEYSEALTLAWRFVRVALTTAIAQVLALQIDWNNAEVALRTVGVAFISGLLAAVSKGLRDKYGSADGSKPIDKLVI